MPNIIVTVKKDAKNRDKKAVLPLQYRDVCVIIEGNGYLFVQ
jgi:hypothetical protein